MQFVLLFTCLYFSLTTAFKPIPTVLKTLKATTRSSSPLNLAKQTDWTTPRVSILTEVDDTPGALHELLRYFRKFNINLTHIESRPCPKNSQGFQMFIDFHGQLGEEKTDHLMKELRMISRNMLVLDEKEVPWFPRHISELDHVAGRVLDAGIDLQCDHPGFHDPVYRTRRSELADIAHRFRYGDEIPYIKYTEEETKTWGIIYSKLKDNHKYACNEYRKIFPLMEKFCGYSETNIPQARDISRYLQSKTGFTLRPVTGLLSSRDFLNGLAFRTFFSTQYIRHSSKPLYTPEPDICHELLGHAPMFADQDFADFSQEIGLASLGASDDDIKKLATCYWFTVEFGLLRDKEKDGGVKAYGAGLLSSFGELEYSCTTAKYDGKSIPLNELIPAPADGSNPNKPNLLPWDPTVASMLSYPITTYQPTYFVAESLADVKIKMREFCEALPRKFYAKYNALTDSIWVDRAVRATE